MIHSFGSGLCGVQGNIHSYSKVGHWKFQGGRGGGGAKAQFLNRIYEAEPEWGYYKGFK